MIDLDCTNYYVKHLSDLNTNNSNYVIMKVYTNYWIYVSVLVYPNVNS